MTEFTKGLTWSKKWHIVDPSKSHDRYEVAMCGAYLHNPVKDGRAFPSHLRKVIDGTAKSTGDCKTCAKAVGKKTADQIFDDEETVLAVGRLIWERSSMVLGDAEDLAWDIFGLIKGQL